MTTDSTKYGLSSAQQQMLAGQLLTPESPVSNMALSCHIKSVIDAALFQQAWAEVSAAHDALGIRITFDDAQSSQTTGHPTPTLELIDLQSDSNPLEAAKGWMQDNVSRAIETSGALGQAALFKLAPDNWIFYLNLHHVICDATSFSVLWKHLALCYERLESPNQHTASSEPVAGDYISFIDSLPSSDDSAEPTPSYLTDINADTKLEVFGVQPKRTDTSATRVTLDITPERREHLAALALSPEARGLGRGIGECNVLLTLFSSLLYRISGASTQTIGLPLPQRQNPSYKHSVGLFVEVLPIQIEIDETVSFAALLQQVRANFMGVLKGAKANDSRHLSANTIASVFNYINAPLGDFGKRTADIKWLHSGHIDGQHLVRLQVEDWQGDGNYSLAFDFNDGVFNATQREQAINAFWQLADAMASDQTKIVDSVAICAPNELHHPHHPKAKTPAYPTVWEKIEENVRQLPSELALAEADQVLNYQQLGTAIQFYANQLIASGVKRGSRVAVYLNRDIRLPQLLLAVHACGATYIPLDSQQPLARVHEILSDASPELLITSSELSGNVDFGRCFLIDDISTPGDALLDSDQSIAIDTPVASDIAYIIYTSGSTGIPKGVEISHESLANYCYWAAEFYADKTAISMPLFTPIGFDLTVTTLFVPLITGGVLHVYNETLYPRSEALNQIIQDDLVDVIKLTPAHLSLLEAEQCGKTNRLSQLIVGGEDLPAVMASRIDQFFSHRVRIHNEYGPTEATVGSVLHTYDASIDVNGSVAIGHPVAGNTLRVLNRAGQDQLPGCDGELYISGPSLANGYWGRTQLTDAQFVELPPTGERYYRTGDVVREDNEGRLYCLGRIDNQFKIRGHRIEAAEIESAALAHPSLNACVAVLANPQSDALQKDKKCTVCGISSRTPGALLNESGVCQPCVNFTQYRDRVDAYFRPMPELQTIVDKLKQNNTADYDCIALLSGGKDSTFALAKLVDMGLRVLAFTLDNGFISDNAKQNIAQVCKTLGVDHRYGTTPSMNAIFRDSLERHANVCNGCFKTIYTMALKLAHDLNINCIMTGLSRGQFFETRLSESWFMAPDYNAEAMDEAIVSARKAYHRIEDTVSCSLDTAFLQSDDVFERVKIVDFYRYCDVHLDDLYRYLDERLNWIRPADTGRSTNCLINDAGIYVHKHERGFHNYSHPYSWDVRLGHKRRDAALEELDDEIDVAEVQSQLKTIGYELSEEQPSSIALYYATDTHISAKEIRRWLSARLPEWMVPKWLVPLPSIPLNINGKVDRQRLPVPTTPLVNGTLRGLGDTQNDTDILAPRNDEEKLLANIWCRHLRIDAIGIDDNFFSMGGDSLMAIRITSELNQAGYPYRPADVFEHQTIAQLAQLELTNRTSENAANVKSNEAANSAKGTEAFSALKGSQLEALSRVLNKGDKHG